MPPGRAAALLAAACILGVLPGCGDDDGREGFPAALAEDAGRRSDAAPASGVCGVVGLADVEAATGAELDPGVAAEGSCTYRARRGRGTLTVHLTERPADAALALETAAGTCDAGSVAAVEVRGAPGAFTCTVSGVGVAAGIAGDAYAVVMAAELGGAPDRAVATAATVLGRVLRRSSSAKT